MIAPRRTAASTILAALAVAVAIPGPSRAATGPVPAGKAPDLALFFTGDVAGYIEPCG